jgi:putative hemolysin
MTMFARGTPGLRAGEARFAARLARDRAQVREAQRLRYLVFAEELGARLQGPEPGVDEDRFDAFCEHLLVRELGSGEVVGTYRILSPQAAERAGGYYSEQEFDLGRLVHLRPGLVELGRSCVHPEYRTGAVIALLWSALGEYLEAGGYTHLIGCASMSMADGGHSAASLYRQMARRHLAPIEYRAFPRVRLPLDRLDAGRDAVLPPLLKGYLRLGAWVCGEPAWDPDFNVADVPVLLAMSRLDRRYARRFIGDATTGVIAGPARPG